MVQPRNNLVKRIAKRGKAVKHERKPQWDTTEGEYLYGIKLWDGTYQKVAANNILHAANKLGITMAEIKRAMPLHHRDNETDSESPF